MSSQSVHRRNVMVTVKDISTPKQIARQKLHAELKNRPCKTCGKPIGKIDKRQVVCSTQCGHAGRSLGKLVVPCNFCGKLVERYKRQYDKFGVASCSLECQRRWALDENRGRKAVDWEVRSKKAKEVWKASSARQRKQRSFGHRFWLLCKIPAETSPEEWERRCRNSSAILKERFIGDIRTGRFIKNWKECLRTNIRRLKNECIIDDRKGWEWKVNSIASGLRKRRRIKSLQQGKSNILRRIERQDQQPKQLSFWE